MVKSCHHTLLALEWCKLHIYMERIADVASVFRLLISASAADIITYLINVYFDECFHDCVNNRSVWIIKEQTTCT